MIDFTLDEERSVLYVRPRSSLTSGDFAELSEAVDSYLDATGGLTGLVIDAPAFPGWDGLKAVAAHLRFVRDHHRRIRKVAVVTDSPLGEVAEQLASHFVSAEIRRFPAGHADAAKRWVESAA